MQCGVGGGVSNSMKTANSFPAAGNKVLAMRPYFRAGSGSILFRNNKVLVMGLYFRGGASQFVVVWSNPGT